ncbi:MAG: Asp-tRNA(Asn)/Glu-tRNA(Gln) amidotransferase subunit GatC [Myxococcales bacterium]|nr:Asp-tRNA(Asn)/Glu-tRNA(Gln) amidotransferase subunit GatC [Myxococcales bacterium]
MKITRDEVRATAALARLALTDEEITRLTRELDAILVYMEKLAAVDVEGIEPMTHAVALACPLREDALGPQLTVEKALADAPASEDGCFLVPRIIAHDKEA